MESLSLTYVCQMRNLPVFCNRHSPTLMTCETLKHGGFSLSNLWSNAHPSSSVLWRCQCKVLFDVGLSRQVSPCVEECFGVLSGCRCPLPVLSNEKQQACYWNFKLRNSQCLLTEIFFTNHCVFPSDFFL